MATDLDLTENEIIIAMRDYIKTLHEAKAVDDVKMGRYYYLPIEELIILWKLTKDE